MAKKSRSSQRAPEISDRIEIQREALPLDQRVVSARRVPIEQVRASAVEKLKVSEYAADPTKVLAKIYRANVLVAQELAEKGEYSVEQIRDQYEMDILRGGYDHQLTVVYQEQKARRKNS